MKLFVIILSIAMTIQVSLAGSFRRFRREDNLAKEVEEWQDLAASLIPVIEFVVVDSLEKLPQAEAFNKQRQHLTQYLEKINEYKTTIGPCMAKTFRIIDDIDFMQSWYKEEALGKLLRENGLSEELQSQVEKLVKDYKNYWRNNAVAVNKLPFTSAFC